MYSLPARTIRSKLLARAVAENASVSGPLRIDLADGQKSAAAAAARRSHQSAGRRPDKRLPPRSRPTSRIGDHFDRLIHVIENHQFAVQPKQQIRQLPVILRRRGKFLPFVIANRVIPRVSDQSAGECGQILIVVIRLGRQKFLQIGQRISGREFLQPLPTCWIEACPSFT